jgi:hypothetical protein
MPSNFERGAYEPADELRVFDGGDDDDDVEGSRLPLLIVIALLVLAAFGGVVWLAYQRGVAQGHSEVPRIIAAEPGPAKVPPAHAGGRPTPYTGLKIYQQPAPSNEDADVDSAPPPPSETLQTKPVMTATAPTPNSAATPVPAPPKPAAATPPARSMAAATAPSAPPPALKPTLLAPPAPATAAPAPMGGALLQIGAYKSQAEANAAWLTYKASHSALLATMSPDVKQVDLGAKGTWYRLRIAAGDKNSATALCDKLKAEGGACFLAR